jgi:hypothetical protein
MASNNENEVVTLVAPNGAERTEAYKPNFKVGNLLKQAVHDFGKEGHLDPSKPFVLVMGETALEEGLTLEEAGVRPGAKLKLRAKKVPADGNAPRAL